MSFRGSLAGIVAVSSFLGVGGSISARAMSLAAMRKEYSSEDLLKGTAPANPFTLFGEWLSEAKEHTKSEANAMCLSTVDPDTCMPSSRIVLLKALDESRFVFYTNYSSRKASELEKNPNASICFWWPELERSVRIQGIISKVSEEESDEYFAKRPRSSQIGAWSSNQSSPVYEDLNHSYTRFDSQFKDKAVPRPPDWGGYQLKPVRFEFWKGKSSRMHDRLEYVLDESEESNWRSIALQP